ncbi:uncharacterized protein BXZ73DRAFT_100689 [Epithele typhae]|uniref:uncharacterized protein n=1 Tax=Epithele typhae TaxID=378194 RepID=UPI0020087ED6|nr:uncharacterized protein BXZ73DRAFT_100689 [Epithele typhae]KAH9934499.1 hypothetical protein BXZ73DRAFT_100689 [Epithele typhae]
MPIISATGSLVSSSLSDGSSPIAAGSTNGNNALPTPGSGGGVNGTSGSLSKNGGLSAGAIAGIVIGLFLLLLLAMLWLMHRRARAKTRAMLNQLEPHAFVTASPRPHASSSPTPLPPLSENYLSMAPSAVTTLPPYGYMSEYDPYAGVGDPAPVATPAHRPVGHDAPLRRQPEDFTLFLQQRNRPSGRSPRSEDGSRAVQSGTSDGAQATSPPSPPSMYYRPNMAKAASGLVLHTGPASTSGALHGGSYSDPSAAAPPPADAEDIASPIGFAWPPTPSSAMSSMPSTPAALPLPAPSAAFARSRSSPGHAADANARQPPASLSFASAPLPAPPIIPEKSREDHPAATATTRPREKRDRTHAPSAMPPSPPRAHTPSVGAEDDLGSSCSLRTTSSGITEYSVDGGVRLAGGRLSEDAQELPPYAFGAPTRARVMPPPYSDLYPVAEERRD